MDFDSVLPDVGAFGLYQKLVICFVLLPALIPCAFHAYSQLFIAARPEHWCRIPELATWENDANFSDFVKELSIPMEMRDGKMRFSKCEMFARNYSEIRELLTQNVPMSFVRNSVEGSNVSTISCKNGWNFDESVFKATVISEWNLVCDKDYYTTLALVLFGVGGLIGNYIFGYLQDSWGRRPSFYTYLMIEVVACALSAVAPNFVIWLALRVVVGLTVPAILASPYVLAIELVGPDKRSFCTLISNISYSIGLVLLSGVVYLVRSWRMLSLAVSVPLLVLLTCFPVLPESPRWLVAIGDYRRAAKIMRKIARVNKKTLPVNYEGVLRGKMEKAGTVTTIQKQLYGISDLFATKNMCKKTLIITFIWFANTSVYVGLSYYAPALGGDEIWNFFLAGAVELPTYFILWPSMHYFGRRWVLCVSMMIGGIACLATFLSQDDKATTLLLYCVGKMGISSAFVVLPLAASELYPTVVRGLGMSFSSVIGMIGPIVIPVINHMGSEMMVLPLLIMGALLTLGGFVSLLLPETMGQPLPQTIDDGEMVPIQKFCQCLSSTSSATSSTSTTKRKDKRMPQGALMFNETTI
ncbi:beta-alanine transporter [Culicoides brevitarsis]|uniref:beta-alanine transporter n=1 Tax=Culicoides brevitarsis TaxID=469753 RepID=UPI00307C890C